MQYPVEDLCGRGLHIDRALPQTEWVAIPDLLVCQVHIEVGQGAADPAPELVTRLLEQPLDAGVHVGGVTLVTVPGQLFQRHRVLTQHAALAQCRR